MLHRPREYVLVVAKSWGGHISGPVLAVAALGLAILGALFADNPSAGVKVVKLSAWLTGGLALVMILVAQYDAWSDERDKYEAEAAKNVLPEIKGEVQTVIVKRAATEDTDPLHSGRCIYTFFLPVCNHRPVDTNIAGVRVSAVHVTPPLMLFDFSVTTWNDDKISRPSEIMLKRGILVKLIITAVGDVPPTTADLSALDISLEDGLGGIHRIPVKKGLQPAILWDASASEEL